MERTSARDIEKIAVFIHPPRYSDKEIMEPQDGTDNEKEGGMRTYLPRVFADSFLSSIAPEKREPRGKGVADACEQE
jgi:hypothetical protein